MPTYEEICIREAIRAFSPFGGVARVEVLLPLAGGLATLFSSDDPAEMLDLCDQMKDAEAELRGFANRQIAKQKEGAATEQTDTIESQSRQITGQYRRDAAPAREVA